jgi:glucosamine-6-phosphate deaminase
MKECSRYAQLLNEQPVSLCCLGIGENGHLAFNDPPVADFEDPHDVKVVRLDDACKMQQVREKHFQSIKEVPPYALTLTLPRLCRAERVICICPETRKAEADFNTASRSREVIFGCGECGEDRWGIQRRVRYRR